VAIGKVVVLVVVLVTVGLVPVPGPGDPVRLGDVAMVLVVLGPGVGMLVVVSGLWVCLRQSLGVAIGVSEKTLVSDLANTVATVSTKVLEAAVTVLMVVVVYRDSEMHATVPLFSYGMETMASPPENTARLQSIPSSAHCLFT